MLIYKLTKKTLLKVDKATSGLDSGQILSKLMFSRSEKKFSGLNFLNNLLTVIFGAAFGGLTCVFAATGTHLCGSPSVSLGIKLDGYIVVTLS